MLASSGPSNLFSESTVCETGPRGGASAYEAGRPSVAELRMLAAVRLPAHEHYSSSSAGLHKASTINLRASYRWRFACTNLPPPLTLNYICSGQLDQGLIVLSCSPASYFFAVGTTSTVQLSSEPPASSRRPQAAGRRPLVAGRPAGHRARRAVTVGPVEGLEQLVLGQAHHGGPSQPPGRSYRRVAAPSRSGSEEPQSAWRRSGTPDGARSLRVPRLRAEQK